jgi:hypothetical protein
LAKKEGGIVGKTFADYWTVVKLPVIVLIVWSIIQSAAMIGAPLMGWALGTIGLLITLVAFLYIGWTGIKTYKLDLAQSAVAGAIAAVISGIVSLIITIIVAATVGGAALGAASMMGFGAPAAAVGGFVMSALIIAGIIGLIVGAIIGAILAAIGAIAAQNMK